MAVTFNLRQAGAFRKLTSRRRPRFGILFRFNNAEPVNMKFSLGLFLSSRAVSAEAVLRVEPLCL
jgi:hypothetical protein